MRQENLNFIFVRHGETDWNRENRLQGHSDIPLNEIGRNQSEAAAEKLQKIDIQSVWSSDLCRAQETARILSAGSGHEIRSRFEFREVHLGEAEGLTRHEMLEKYGSEFLQKWSSSDPSDFQQSFPGGETKQKAVDRFLAGISEISSGELIADRVHLPILLVSHGLILRSVLAKFQVLPRQPFMIPNTGSLHCSWDGKSLKLISESLENLEIK